MENQICVVSIYVPNLQQAVEFYTNTLNFEVNKYYGEKIVSLENGNLPFILEEKQGELSTGVKPFGVVLALQTQNIEETLAHLKSKNVQFIVDAPTNCPPGKFISFTDPFGNIIEYLQFG